MEMEEQNVTQALLGSPGDQQALVADIRPQDGRKRLRLRRHEQIAAGIKRIAIEQLDEAIGHLKTSGKDPDDAIHDARADIKRIRAILRLVRGEIGEKVFRRENTRYRDAARRLSAVRDTAAMVEALDKLGRRFPDEVAPATFGLVRASLVQAEKKEPAAKEEAMSEVEGILLSARQEVFNWPIKTNDFSAIERGLKLTYAEGRRGFERALCRPSIRNFHEWRKQVKYLWYQMSILRASWPKLLRVLAGEIGKLADYLNDDHDLAMLRRAVPERRGMDDAADSEALRRLANHARRKLRAKTRVLGHRIYAQKPGAFARSVSKYWKSNLGGQ
jgi:CHAD domain-containing protein